MEFNFWTKLKTVAALAVALPFVSLAQNPIVQTSKLIILPTLHQWYTMERFIFIQVTMKMLP